MIAYFVVASLFFYTGVPVYAIPHGALGLEMTEDYHEKDQPLCLCEFHRQRRCVHAAMGILSGVFVEVSG
jgi:hypothetical protein